jgi:DNA (cytosine-5)-methyltransferase 1
VTHGVATRPRVLSLCSGYGGLDLGVRAAVPSARVVCYVERDVQAAAILAKQMRAGGLDSAPIWSDVSTFDARAWRGAVDLVVAGFPCQPVSVAGRKRGLADERWLWPDVERVIRDSGCAASFLENVPGIATTGLRDVLGGLASLGLDAEWGLYRASDVGAPHLRERWFCLAYPRCERPHWLQSIADAGRDGAAAASSDRTLVADTDGNGRKGKRRRAPLDGIGTARGDDANGCGRAEAVGNTDGNGRAERSGQRNADRTAARGRHRFPPGPDQIDEWDGPKPALRGDAHGFAARLDRLRILGNGVVPQQAAYALRDLAGRVT